MFFFLQQKNTNSDVNATVNCMEQNQKTASLQKFDVNWFNKPAKAIKADVGGLRMMQIFDGPSKLTQSQTDFFLSGS